MSHAIATLPGDGIGPEITQATLRVLDAADRHWIPVRRDWRLNERSYGALTGYGKREVAERYGHDLFLHWRRSFDGRPDPLPDRTVDLWRTLPPFDRLPPQALAPTESLADVVELAPDPGRTGHAAACSTTAAMAAVTAATSSPVLTYGGIV